MAISTTMIDLPKGTWKRANLYATRMEDPTAPIVPSPAMTSVFLSRSGKSIKSQAWL